MGTLVLSVKSYEFKGNDGRDVEGCSVFFVADEKDEARDKKGCMVLKITGNKSIFHDFGVVPGFYNLKTITVPGAGGQLKLKCVGAEFLSGVEFKELVKK